ncbi:hypothetical protein GALL_450410 [mine drainage metagenome]|uniref:Uncharacterized protein n=1 Tax=mine drainage metagenome TaxID=410659 RepID=A0A1J5Q0F6_9ZZZZ
MTLWKSLHRKLALTEAMFKVKFFSISPWALRPVAFAAVLPMEADGQQQIPSIPTPPALASGSGLNNSIQFGTYHELRLPITLE